MVCFSKEDVIFAICHHQQPLIVMRKPSEQDAKQLNPDRLTTPYTPDYFKEHGAILYQFVPIIRGNELLPGEVKYGYRFYLLDDPNKEGVFYLSSHKDIDTLKSRSKFLLRVEREIAGLN
jgi:hypothetical protein